jgi:hypothetical protein
MMRFMFTSSRNPHSLNALFKGLATLPHLSVAVPEPARRPVKGKRLLVVTARISYEPQVVQEALMETLRLYYHFATDLGSALMLALSTGAGCAILAASFTRTVEGTVLGAAAGFLISAFGFSYALWRTYKPQLRNGRVAA